MTSVKAFDDVKLRSEWRDKLVSVLLSGDCLGVKEFLKKVSEARKQLNTMFEPSNNITINAVINGSKEVSKYLANGLKCFRNTLLDFRITVIAVEVKDREPCEDSEMFMLYPLTQVVHFNTVNELHKIMGKVVQGEVPYYQNIEVGAETFVRNLPTTVTYYGKEYKILPEKHRIVKAFDIGEDVRVFAVESFNNILLKVATTALIMKRGVNESEIVNDLREASKLAKKHGIGRIDKYVIIEVNE